MPLRPFRPPSFNGPCSCHRPLPSLSQPRQPRLSSAFHTSLPRKSPDNRNHYEVLEIKSSATPQEIKRQFFSLSKLHHPDKNRDDPTASTRFVEISEAYHVLSVPEKRAQYDAELYAARGQHRQHEHPKGSYSSASFAGARAPTGLSKKRGTFRGPPPSFYKSGGYGKHGAKREQYAYQSAPGAGSTAGGETAGRDGGLGSDPEVPHFDDMRHKRTHDSINEAIYAGRRARMRSRPVEEFDRGGMIFNFILVSSALGIIIWSSTQFGDKESTKKTHDRTKKDA